MYLCAEDKSFRTVLSATGKQEGVIRTPGKEGYAVVLALQHMLLFQTYILEGGREGVEGGRGEGVREGGRGEGGREWREREGGREWREGEGEMEGGRGRERGRG